MKRSILILFCLLICSCSRKLPEPTVNVLEYDTSVREYGDILKLSDIITNTDITYEDSLLPTSKLGLNNRTIKYEKEGKMYQEQIQYTIDDTTAPLIWVSSTFNVKIGFKGDPVNSIICTDNYDARPACYIEGNYDTDVVGVYPVTIKAVDSFGNEASKDISINVYEPTPVVTTVPKEETHTLFSDVYELHKTPDTLIGIDVSRWQGDIDWEKVKNAGVEFAIIRLGGQSDFYDNDFYIDSKFEDNINGAINSGIKIGVYFYSYAVSASEARKQANFVMKKIDKYNIEMPVAYDWENFNKWNDVSISLFNLRNASYTFQTVLKKHGYTPIQYGSKNYLSTFWAPIMYDTWLAHYVDETNYDGEYKMWQLCDNGVVDGINGNVDIDIYYN